MRLSPPYRPDGGWSFLHSDLIPRVAHDPAPGALVEPCRRMAEYFELIGDSRMSSLAEAFWRFSEWFHERAVEDQQLQQEEDSTTETDASVAYAPWPETPSTDYWDEDEFNDEIPF